MANINGNAYINGTAYSNGSPGGYTGGGKFWGGASKYNGYNYGNNNNNNAGKAKDDFEEFIDWIEVMIDRLERKIDRVDSIIDSTFKTFSKRKDAIVDNFSNVTKEIDLQTKAAERYRQEADKIALSEAYKQKIINGTLDIEEIHDKDLKKLIDDYQKWYEKSLDCQDAVVDLKEKLGELVETNFDNVSAEFDGLIEGIEHKIDMLEGQLDIIESRGNFAGKQYFQQLMTQESEAIKTLEIEYQKLQDARNDALGSGAIEEGSEAAVDMENQINDVAKAWQDAKKQVIDYKNEMWEADWAAFEWAQDRISDMTAESEFVQGLLNLGENDLFVKETGRLNTKGNTTGALHAMNYDVYMAQADEYRKKVEEINAELANDPNNTILLNKKKEYIEAQRDSIQAANDEKVAIHDLIEESYNRMLKVLQELIDKRKEALQKEKDLYDFQKDVEEQTKNITDLQKQLMAIQGDDSEEAKAKKQGLQDELKKAESDLEETMYDKYLDDQQQMMDKLYDEAEKLFNERLDDINGMLQQMIDYGNANADTVSATITTATENVGYNITEGIGALWNGTDSGVNHVLTVYGNDFSSKLTTINTYIKGVFDMMKASTQFGGKVEKPKDTSRPANGGSFNKPAPAPKPKPAPAPKPKVATVGGMINAKGATIYSNAYGGGGSSQYFANDPRYVVLSKQNGYLLTRWHGSSAGYTGWFKESDVTAMKTGGYTGNSEGMAMLHKKERVLNAQQTKAFESLVYGLLPSLSENMNKISSTNISGRSIGDVTVGDIHFELPNVTDTQSFMRELQNNKKFEKLVQSMVLDPLNGKGALNKKRIKI